MNEQDNDYETVENILQIVEGSKILQNNTDVVSDYDVEDGVGNVSEGNYIDVETIDEIRNSLIGKSNYDYVEVEQAPRKINPRCRSVDSASVMDNREFVTLRKAGVSKESELKSVGESETSYENTLKSVSST